MQLQEVFSSYKKERLESDKALTEQNDKLLQQLSDLRSQNAKMETQLEFTSKRSVLSSKQDHLLYYTFWITVEPLKSDTIQKILVCTLRENKTILWFWFIPIYKKKMSDYFKYWI